MMFVLQVALGVILGGLGLMLLSVIAYVVKEMNS